MYKLSRFAGVFGCVAALGLSACAGSSGVAPATGSMVQPQARGMLTFGPGWIQKDGVLYHAPHYMATRSAARGQVSPAIVLSYGGGVVQVTPTVFLITWGYSHYGDRQN